jgi:two-component system, chemotaxis family, sensor kinase CheA
MTQFSDDRGAEMRELFFETTQELLQTLNDDALRLEKAPQDKEVVRSIRRTVHTLKGDAAACGFRELSDLAHMMEDALAVEDLSATVSLAELAFTAADVFGAMLVAYRQQVPVPDCTPLKKMVQALAKSGSEVNISPKPTGRDISWTEYELSTAEIARAEGSKVYHVTAQVDPLCAMPIAARQLIVNALESLAEVLATRPEPGVAAQAKVLDLLVASTHSEAEILAKCQIPTVIARAECNEVNPSEPKAETPQAKTASTAHEKDQEATTEAASSTGQTKHTAENVLRVDAERIDNVLNLVGELIIAKSMMQQSVFEFTRRFPKDTLRARFADAMGFQSRVLSDLQRSVMKIRMVPVEQLFRRFPRMVRDAAKRCNKQVQLVLSGQDTDLDKGLLDAIAEPLTHIVRNAISHGLESGRDRKAAGKNPVGTIRLDAYHQANQLIVEVSDDGAGIDHNKLKAKALKIDLINNEEAERMSAAEALDLIFRPGFSTAEEITEISGRGVGLDVVRSVLHRLKGTVELETQLGQGTKFRLKLPLTLAIIKALLFRIEHRLYAIPLNSVAEIARAKGTEIHRVDTTEVLQLRNQVLPLARLGDRREDDSNARFFVLVTTFGERKLGLVVDALEGEEELVIKALDDQTVATDLVSGASILGDGRVVLIMNLAAVMERFTRNGTNVGHFAMPADGLTATSSEVRQ